MHPGCGALRRPSASSATGRPRAGFGACGHPTCVSQAVTTAAPASRTPWRCVRRPPALQHRPGLRLTCLQPMNSPVPLRSTSARRPWRSPPHTSWTRRSRLGSARRLTCRRPASSRSPLPRSPPASTPISSTCAIESQSAVWRCGRLRSALPEAMLARWLPKPHIRRLSRRLQRHERRVPNAMAAGLSPIIQAGINYPAQDNCG